MQTEAFIFLLIRLTRLSNVYFPSGFQKELPLPFWVLFVVVRFNKIRTKQRVESSLACHMRDLITCPCWKLLLPPALGSTETLQILLHKLSFVKCFAADFVVSFWEFGHHELKEKRNMYFMSSLLKSILPPPLFYCSSILFSLLQSHPSVSFRQCPSMCLLYFCEHLLQKQQHDS